MADKSTEYKTKSVYFTKNEFTFLDKIVDKCKATNTSISDYFKELAAEDIKENKKLPKYMEERIIELIKKYAPAVNANDIKEDIKDFDPETLAAINQFDDI